MQTLTLGLVVNELFDERVLGVLGSMQLLVKLIGCLSCHDLVITDS